MSDFDFKGHVKDEEDFQIVLWDKASVPTLVNDSTIPTTNAERLLWIEKIYKAIVMNKEVGDNQQAQWSWTRGKYSETAIEVCAWQILVCNSKT
jgi:hypothetical protein